MHEKRFDGKAKELRSAQRLAVLEVEQVVELCLQGITVKSVVDVGTGNGLFAEAFHKRGLTASGVDVSAEMLAEAATYMPDADLRVGAAEAIPFADGSFDLVFMGHVLHETDDPQAALNEARRVGRLRTAVLEWAYEGTLEFGPPQKYRVKPAEVEEWCKNAGFSRCKQFALKHMMLYVFDVNLDS